MDLQSNNALVNRSGTQIPVYSTTVSSQIHTGGITAGGTVLGHIWPDEFYTLVGENNYVTCRLVYFRDGSGSKRTGYIETSPGSTLGDYSWVSSQEPYHYYNSNGSSLVSAGTVQINGSTYYKFTTTRSLQVLDPSASRQFTLAASTEIATNCSTTGATHPLLYTI